MGPKPRVMFTMRSGTAWTGRPGDRVGSNECIYRIDAIRSEEVTLVAIDPTRCPTRPARRILHMHERPFLWHRPLGQE